ncbi:MAG: DUF4278 domain-containing protein [Cyanobacteria bacterium P01_A01_bin.105]
MQLSYRGVKYTVAQPDIAVVEADTTATYRGATYRVKRATGNASAHPTGLKYRGVVVR